MNVDDPTLQSVVEEFKRTGWVMAILGMLGMIARLILTNEKFVWAIWTRKAIAGGIVGVLCYFGLYEADIAPLYRSVIIAVAGSIAPELFDIIRKKFIKTVKE
jgi:hypothetical protein